jgi:hypothetical protein
MFNFVQVQGQFRRKAELDSRQAARKGDPAGLRERLPARAIPQDCGRVNTKILTAGIH